MQILVMRFKKNRKVNTTTLLSKIKRYTTMPEIEYTSMDIYLSQMCTDNY